MCRRCKEVEPTGGLERVGGGDGLDGGVEDVYRHKLDGGADYVFKRPKPDTGTCSTGGSRRRGKKEITKYPWEIEMEEQQAIDDCTCPVCGDYNPLNGMIKRVEEHWFKPTKEFRLYECRKCGTRWEIRIR